jgi:hypothetical protein
MNLALMHKQGKRQPGVWLLRIPSILFPGVDRDRPTDRDLPGRVS